MAYEQKDMSGSIFKNQKRESENHPNMTGSAKINGIEYWVSAWTKEGEKGKWISLAFKPKDSAPTKPAPKSREPGEDDEDIPF